MENLKKNVERVERGERFKDKYGVEEYRGTYKLDPEQIVVPGKGHALYDPDGNTTFDPLLVEEIDRDGKFGDVIKVWTDIDRREIVVVEGRGQVFALREVNRRRRERGDAVLEALVLPLKVDLDRAVEHVRLRNFHRKQIRLGHLGREIVCLWKLGKPWARIAEILHIPEATEAYLKGLASLNYAIPEVVEAVESGKLPLRTARQFGGHEIDGSDALSVVEQRKLFATKSGEGKKRQVRREAVVGTAARRRLGMALADDESVRERIHDRTQQILARGFAAVLARLSGHKAALENYPELAAFIEAALAEKPKRGRPKKETVEVEAKPEDDDDENDDDENENDENDEENENDENEDENENDEVQEVA